MPVSDLVSAPCVHSRNGDQVIGSFVWADWCAEDERALRLAQSSDEIEQLETRRDLVTRLLGSASAREGPYEWRLWSEERWLSRIDWLDNRRRESARRKLCGFLRIRGVDDSDSDLDFQIPDYEDPPKDRDAEKEKHEFLCDIKRYYQKCNRPFKVVDVEG